MTIQARGDEHQPTQRIPFIGVLLAIAAIGYSVAANRRRAYRPAEGRAQDRPAIPGPQDHARAGEPGRGREAAWPSEIPSPGWWDILKRVKADISDKNLSLIAAGAAFYALLAIPSAFTALVSLYGLVFDPGDIGRQVQGMQGILPQEAIGIIADQLKNLTQHGNSTLGIGFVVSLSLALWSARSATSSMISALNIAYEEPEKRSFLRFQAIAFGLTVGAVFFALVALALIAVLPAIVGFLPLGALGKTLTALAPWPILVLMVMVVLAAIYRFAPSRREPRWRWVSWGAVAATVLWILGSAAFSLYVGKFASYDKTYGSLGGVVVLLMWLYLSSFVILLGAALNAQIEHQTVRDSTGRKLPLGARGAKMADTVGRRA